jgi:hypothetical protein
VDKPLDEQLRGVLTEGRKGREEESAKELLFAGEHRDLFFLLILLLFVIFSTFCKKLL